MDNLFSYYQKTINTLDQQTFQLQNTFQEQMQCRKGCSGCCLSGFRIRFIEGLQLLKGYSEASPETAMAILSRLQDASPEGSKFCPVLVDGTCSLYEHRPALCRAFGVIIHLKDKYATCELNFQNVDDISSLQALELEPYYEILNDLSKMLWDANPQWKTLSEGEDPPLFTIRQLFEVFFKTQGIEIPSVDHPSPGLPIMESPV